MSSACIQSNGDGESQVVVQMSASPGETADAAAVATTEDVPKTPPIAMKNLSTPEKEKDSPNREPGSPIGDDACPICLGEISDRCVADSCFHGFCLICLKEWSKQKPVCPLCKQKFTKIMYDIKSESDYKEWKVPVPDPQQHHNVTLNLENFREFLNVENRRFFGYHTTIFPGALALHRHFPRRGQNLNTIPDAIPSGPRERRPSRYNLRGSSMFRLSVYLNNVWVQPLADITGRYRQTGPELYREQPALTHRLAPWVNRELTALLPEPRIGTVLREMMQLIEQYPINSREFRRTMQPHLGSRTNHFIHEFYNFARSPYDMVGHDNAAQYIPRYGNVNDTDSSSSSDDSDAIVEVDSRGNPLLSLDANLAPPPATTTTIVPVVRQETLTQEGSVVISSGSSSSSNTSSEDESTRLTNNGLSSETHNPEPPSRFMKRLIKRARTFLSTVNSGASTSSVQVGSGSGASSSGSSSRAAVHADSLLSQTNGPTVQGDNSDDGCMIIEEFNRIEPPPELINLSSDGGNGDDQEDESISNRLLRRGKTKPSLRRNNFANRKPVQEPDHTYCTANSSSTVYGTTSNTPNNRNVQSKKRRRARISEERKRSSVNDSDYIPDEFDSEYLSLSSSDTSSSSHSEWGPSSERHYKKRSLRKQKNRNEIANTRLNKKKADLDSQSESGSNSDSDSDLNSVSDKVSYYKYLQRLNKNRKEKENNQEKNNNTRHSKKLSPKSNLVLEESRVPPIPSSSHVIDSDSLSENENSTRNMTSTRTHTNIKQIIKHKTDNPSKVKKSFSIQFNNPTNVKQEAGVLSGIDKEQILRRRILARQKLLKASIDDDLSENSTDSMKQKNSHPGSSSEKSHKEQLPSESSQYSLCSRKKDHSSKVKKSYKKAKTEYEEPFECDRKDTSISSKASKNDHSSSVESQTKRKRNRKSSKEKKKKKKKKDEREKYKEREKSKRKEKKKKRTKSKKIRRIESSSEEKDNASVK